MTAITDQTGPLTAVLTLVDNRSLKLSLTGDEYNSLAHDVDHAGGYSRFTHDGTESNGMPYVVDVTKVIALQVENPVGN